jgi:hypothetical protein
MEAEGTPGGVIEGQATGDMTVQGRYSADAGGCIGLVAGGTLTITLGSTFLPPEQTTPCP